MKKIATREEKSKKDKRNQLIIGIVLIMLMLLSTAGYALSGNEGEQNSQKVIYKGQEFVLESSGYWSFASNGREFITKYNPNETSDIISNVNLKTENYADKPLYVKSDYQDSGMEILRNLDDVVLRWQRACIDEGDCEGDFPVKSCSTDNIIIIEESEKEKIYQQENCIFIKSSLQNQSRYEDAVLFRILGIQ